ncbi:MAG: hypothetical protein ACKVP3_10485 [Hyphomicrobiaceae bacterium]
MDAANRQKWIDEARQHADKVRGDIEITITEKPDGVDVFGRRETGAGRTHTGHVLWDHVHPVSTNPVIWEVEEILRGMREDRDRVRLWIGPLPVRGRRGKKLIHSFDARVWWPKSLPSLKSTDASLVDAMEHANSLRIIQIALGISRTPIWR